ncbi:hypothetical protein Golob_023916, partial [Gossypium lobatum]|nr:hypothetical protein [Gossypium lobatum]
MVIGAEVGEMGWDLSLRAQSRRALAMNSVWLREDVKDWVGTTEERQGLRPSTRVPRGSLGQYRNIDPILGFNLEGQSPFFKKSENSYTLMDHDSEDRVIALEEGKKRTRREIDEARQGLEVDYVWLGVGISVLDFKAIPKTILMCSL